MVDGPDDARRDLEVGPCALGAQRLDGKHARIPRDACDSEAVVRRGGRDAGDQRPVADRAVVARVGIARDEIAAGEELRGEVGDRGHAGVDDRDDDASRPVAQIPGQRRPDRLEVRLGRGEVGIVRRIEGVPDVIESGRGDRRCACERGDGSRGAAAVRVDGEEPRVGDLPRQRETPRRKRGAELGGAGARPRPDDYLARRIGGMRFLLRRADRAAAAGGTLCEPDQTGEREYTERAGAQHVRTPCAALAVRG